MKTQLILTILALFGLALALTVSPGPLSPTRAN